MLMNYQQQMIKYLQNLSMKKQIQDVYGDTRHVTATGTLGAYTPRQLAEVLFNEKSVSIDQVCPILCRNDPYHHEACKEYLNLFDLKGLQIDEALRMVLRKIPLIGETHSVERLLRVLSKRYCTCTAGQNELSESTVNLLFCSLMLLNSDLHFTVLKKQMRKDKYVKNIMNGVNPSDKKPPVILLEVIL
ncbi:hypothetical protein MXB_1048 [Myxobolus squamalis]|nr:hypothetical protein MXB_1048 [Myxobolus squamalis]